MKKLASSLALASSLLCAAPAVVNASTFTFADVDVINQTMTAGTGTAVYNGEFNFFPADFDANTFTATDFGPANGTYVSNFGYQLGTPIIEGAVTFFFKDPDTGVETGSVTANFSSVGSISTFADYSVFSQGLELAVLTSISSSGILSYTVTASSGEFELVAGIGSITVNVPDGGTTLAMLGGSLMGMVALRKRFLRK